MTATFGQLKTKYLKRKKEAKVSACFHGNIPSFSTASTQTLGYISDEYVANRINVDVRTNINPLDS